MSSVRARDANEVSETTATTASAASSSGTRPCAAVSSSSGPSITEYPRFSRDCVISSTRARSALEYDRKTDTFCDPEPCPGAVRLVLASSAADKGAGTENTPLPINPTSAGLPREGALPCAAFCTPLLSGCGCSTPPPMASIAA